jgi:Kringle domain
MEVARAWLKSTAPFHRVMAISMSTTFAAEPSGTEDKLVLFASHCHKVIGFNCLSEPFNTPDHAPLAGFEENYCRNPDGDFISVVYTIDNDTRLEFCNVPICEVLYANGTNWSDDGEADIGAETEERSTAVCGSAEVGQSDYRGTLNVTDSGRTCQHWDTLSPHHHDRTHEKYPGYDLAEN